MSERERFNELVTEAIRSAMDCVQVGDFRDPSAHYKEQAAKEDRAALMSAYDALQERVARATEAVAYPAPPPEVRNHDDYYAGCAAYRNALRASLSAKEGP